MCHGHAAVTAKARAHLENTRRAASPRRRCAIGNLNLKAALARQTSNVEFKVGRCRAEPPWSRPCSQHFTLIRRLSVVAQVHYRPYVLHPEVPEEGMRKAPATFYGQRVRGAGTDISEGQGRANAAKLTLAPHAILIHRCSGGGGPRLGDGGLSCQHHPRQPPRLVCRREHAREAAGGPSAIWKDVAIPIYI